MRKWKSLDIGSAWSAALLVCVAVGCGRSSSGDAGGSGGTTGTGGVPGVSTGGQDGQGGEGAGGTPVHPTCPGLAAAAYEGTVPTLPGTLQAEDFDPAGYSDATTGNEGTAYRTDVDVDIKELGAGFALGWMTAGEWIEFTVNVPVAGDYDVTVQAGAVDSGRTFLLSQCEQPLGEAIAVPEVADWGQVATSSAVSVHLQAGLQVIRVTVGPNDYADLDSISFELIRAGEGTGGAGTGGAGTGGNGTGGSGTGGDGTGGAEPGVLPRFVGNIDTSGGQMDINGMTYADHWNQVTPENAGKWGSVQSTGASAFNWGTLDAIYDYAQDHGIIFKQHVFVWGAQQPSGNLTEANVKAWMSNFCARYPETKLIDVVNEPPPHTTPSYANNIGGGTNGNWAWITNAFKWAREACPGAILILNDYNNIEYADQTQHFIDIAKAVLAAGGPIDALGAQAHGLGGGITATTMQNLLTKMHNDTGLPVYITEYDIGLADDAAQLAKYQQHIPFFRSTEWIPGITLWGWIHGHTWVDDTGIVKGSTPRPAMTWLMNELDRPVP
ncbi:MAG TPA: endo-1,4-beta-xylanase [Polyangiaceae bacterium]|nr:endo-1,4-beta-xylanase [Polyangiaceae bacterium]